jgi:hypothetical protein
VNFAVDYIDDTGYAAYPATVKEMVGRGQAQAAAYDGTLPELMRDWVGVDSRAAEGANGPAGNTFDSPTNLTFTLTGLPAGSYQYRAYHHDVAGIQGTFELTITDATRTDASLGDFQMTTGGNPVFDATGNTGTAGVDAATLSFAAGNAPPAGAETRTLFAGNIGQAVVANGTLEVYVFYYPVDGSGDYPVRAGLTGGTSIPGANPGPGNPPSALPSTLTIPFESGGSPVVFTDRVFETPGDESLSVNGIEITGSVPDFRITSIEKSGGNITLTWLSGPGKSYDIFGGTDLQGFPIVAVDGVASQSATTTHLFPPPAALVGQPRAFFIVEENP